MTELSSHSKFKLTQNFAIHDQKLHLSVLYFDYRSSTFHFNVVQSFQIRAFYMYDNDCWKYITHSYFAAPTRKYYFCKQYSSRNCLI